MELIASMIRSTKQRIAPADIRISVMWAALTITTAITVWITLLATRNPCFNFLWFSIPVIGIPSSIILSAKSREKRLAASYIDKVSTAMWRIIGSIAIGLTVACLVAQLYGHPQAWLAMFYYAFIIVGFGAAITGLLLREYSYTLGGLFSIFAGFSVIICNLCHVPLLYSWVIPLYILCFLLMFIIPASIVARKNKTQQNDRT